ncbi:MAG: hypothetical protein M1826_005881 [Phylliscum demangeonii]|nr:MAG: hypothetical protein M1826_005881 [Phylliscum demangeonii]
MGCTGEAFIILQVPDDPRTVYYFLVESLTQQFENWWDDIREAMPDGETLPAGLKLSILLNVLPVEYVQGDETKDGQQKRTAVMIEGTPNISFDSAVSQFRNLW